MIASMAAVALGNLAFGFATNIYVAIGVRLILLGMCNGWVSLMGMCTLEVAGEAYQTQVFSYIISVGSVTATLGPAIAGWTYGVLGARFPALAPSLVGFGLGIVAVAVTGHGMAMFAAFDVVPLWAIATARAGGLALVEEEAVARHVAPPPPSALTLLGQAASSNHLPAAAVPTGLAALDAHLGGGLPMRAVTELVGPAGSGKTQLCSSVAAHALLAGAGEGTRVIYIDTEGSFSAKRLLQLLRTLGAPSAMDQAGATAEAAPALASSLARGVPPAEELLRRLTVYRPSTWADFCTVVSEQLELDMLTPPRVGLLIVDSIAMAAHRGFDRGGNVLRRQSAVVALAARLKLYADAFATCVLCVNHVVAGPVGGYGRGEVGDASSRVWIGPDKVETISNRGHASYGCTPELDPANPKSYMSSVDEFVKSKMHNMAVWLWVQSEPSILMNEPF
ncbi:DNA repair protein rad51-like 2-like protein [Chrysochromulina tobinii]|uniref:DNA repair protein rad51-like 2-like protein n=1 Tax=Chrysochromulina tobinii TaxID=1460289 RepID=A0A0M0J6R0_9EUKA|nr:DNA repair protein rad51-like 2-like protein [Chrysochromulina tobinii]|eukprot:KOO22299.1 DNA repair protein rad51-like 2-like protein [Chrysochromulina sp. CCMP291]